MMVYVLLGLAAIYQMMKLWSDLKASGNEDMIQNTEKPKWGEFRKRLEIVGGQIVDKTTGELVEGVQIIEKPDTFTVDV